MKMHKRHLKFRLIWIAQVFKDKLSLGERNSSVYKLTPVSFSKDN